MLKKAGWGALVGGLLTAALMGVLYLANQAAGAPFTPFDLFNWVTRVLPGDLVTFGIDSMISAMRLLGLSVVDLAKTAERISAILQFLGIGIVLGAVFFVILSRQKITNGRTAGLIVGALFGLPIIGISLAITQTDMLPLLSLVWLLVIFLVWGWLLGFSYSRLFAPEVSLAEPMEETAAAGDGSVRQVGRRKFLVQLGAGTALITVVGAGIGKILAQAEQRRLDEELAATMAHNSEEASPKPFPNSDDPVTPVPGTRPEYTPVKDHYEVFIQTEPTVIDGASWILPITGMVDNPLMLTLDDFQQNYDSMDQYVTLSCISGRIGTGLISTTQWTGVSVQDVLADAGVQDGAKYLFITSGDGFYESIALDLINSDRRIMFCYAWDGNLLPHDHGFPLRVWIPDRFGMKQPKWITGIEVTDEYHEGYWVERNWDEVAQVKTTSVIDTVVAQSAGEDGQGDRKVLVGGIAFAGARGISQVQVRVDGGAWEDAELRSPLSETTWVIWRYEWPFTEGEHLFEVRCAEADGTPQIEETMGSRPSGATGIHSVQANI
ncbi:MAG: molybdopterin-dependent oxidoreductase [Candidatus Promineifilaceae bacterium]